MATRRRENLDHELRALAAELDAASVPAPPPELVDRTLRAARGELMRSLDASPAKARPQVPTGFKTELARLLVATALPLALIVAINVQVIRLAPAFLAEWLPAELAVALVAMWGLGSFGWLAVAYATLPFAAHRRARLRVGQERNG